MQRRLFLGLLVLPVITVAQALIEPRLRAVVQVERSLAFGSITVRAFVDVPVDARLAWSVLTDYDHLAEFVPDMHYSRRVSRPGEPVRVHQKGEKSWLILDTPFEVVLLMQETPYSRIHFRQLSGTLKDMYGEWRLLPLPGGVRITYVARLEPGLLSPRVPGDGFLIEADIQRMLEAIGREMLRRGAGRAAS
ncbi:MAG: SRPBCC family protein [Thiobacillaceae bacterium]|nr:SRPBCC family protein [Thiobacillaceae bacterium]MCX7672791.1 SRPBCC family protein [Thiobacillaceae bacterium]MDW8324639.1 SRPBCC family protein [Burkholderiales bacterium]